MSEQARRGFLVSRRWIKQATVALNGESRQLMPLDLAWPHDVHDFPPADQEPVGDE